MIAMALKTLKRDWRAGEVKVLFFAIAIAVCAMTVIGVLTQRVQGSMGEQASEFLGADYRISSTRELPKDWQVKAKTLGLTTANYLSFSSVLSSQNEFQLVSVKAIETEYPLKGKLKISKQSYSETLATETSEAPRTGTVWVDPAVLNGLKIDVGDQVDFGRISLTVTGVIVAAPGQVSEVFNVSPAIILNQKDVAAAQVIQAGSRVGYNLLIAGELAARESFIGWLKPQISAIQRITGGKEGTPALQDALNRAETFLNLATLVSVLLAGVAIAVASGRYSQRHYDYAAIYRCLGMASTQVHKLYLWQLFIMGLVGSVVGAVLGMALQETIIWKFADILPKPMVAISTVPVTVAIASGLVVLLGFALPAFLQIAKVPPLRVLRKEALPIPFASWLIYGAAIGAMALLMWWQSGSWLLVVILLLVALVAYCVIRLMAWFIFKLGTWLGQKSSLSIRFGLGQLKRYPKFTLSQISAFGMAFMIMLSIYLIRTELLEEWKKQLPDNAPNHFLINVQDYEVETLNGILERNKVETGGVFPMVRGRVTELNGQAVSKVLSKDEYSKARALRRELNLTWMESLPNANTLVEGDWWQLSDDNKGDSAQTETTKPVKISISTEIKEMAKLDLGDTLLFDIGGLTVEGQVANVRKIQWDSFQPNFFVIFEPQGLQDFPASYITSFHIDKAQKPLLADLLEAIPTVTIIELDKIMEQVQKILEQVTLAIEFIMLFVLLAGIAVLYAVLQSSRDERVLSATLLKTLGAKNRFIRTSLLAELAILGVFSGVLAVLASEILVSVLYINALDLEAKFHPWVWLLVPLLGAAFIATAGWFGVRSLLKQPASQVLRQA